VNGPLITMHGLDRGFGLHVIADLEGWQIV